MVTLRAALVAAAVVVWAAPLFPQTAPPTGGVEVEDLGDPGDQARRQSPGLELESQAEAAYGDGDLEKAIGLYRQVVEQIQKPADRSRVLITVAWLELLQGRPDAAGQDLERALVLAPETRIRSELYNDEFVKLFLDAQPKAVAARVREASEKARAAVQAINAGDLGTARELLRQTLALQPDQPRALYNLAVVDLREGNSEAALAGFEKVISLGEARPDAVPADLRGLARTSAGLVYLTRGQDAEAAATLEQAVAIAPGDGRAWNGLGVARRRLGRQEAAITAFQRAQTLRPEDEEVVDNLGRSYVDAARWVDAVAVLLEGTRQRPASPRLWLSLGLAQRGLGNLDGARISLERVLELDPADSAHLAEQASSFLAMIHLEGRRFEEAAREARRALSWNDRLPETWTQLGMAQKELGDLAGARQSLERAVALAPERAESVYNLGTVLLVARDVPAARAAFQRALELRPGFSEAATILARLDTAPPATGPAATPTRTPVTRPRRTLGARLSEANYPELGLQGLRVDAVERNGLAERSGLQAADLLLRVDGKPLVRGTELGDYLESRPAKSAVVLDLLRAGRPLRVSLALE